MVIPAVCYTACMTTAKITVVLAVIILTGCTFAGTSYVVRKHAQSDDAAKVAADQKAVRYVPLGDSYTIGEGVAASERWPNQLAASYIAACKHLQIIANPAVTGYTTQNLIDRELPLLKQLRPDFVTVLIGANDLVKGVDAQTFQQNLHIIVRQVQQQLAKPENVLLVTIPDFAKTPSGARFGDPVAATAAIAQFNQIIAKAGATAKLPVADIFASSQLAATQPDLVAPDGLHPTGKQYQTWGAIIQKVLTSAHIPH